MISHDRTRPVGLFVLLAVGGLLLTVGCGTTKVAAPMLVDWEIESSHPYVMAGGATEQAINVDVSASLPEGATEGIPSNLSIVIDHSGSMTGEQLDDAKKALRYMLSQLKEEDRISVIAFSTHVEVLVGQSEWGDVDKDELFAAIDAIEPRGTTAMQGALQTAYNEVVSQFDAGRVNRILLLSDGIPNDGSQLMSIANNARSYGVAISTFGLGPYYNEDLMTQLADTSGGNYRFIRNSEELVEYFAAEQASMEQVVARNAQLIFNLGPGVELVQTLGANASVNGRQVTVWLGELGPSDARQVALKLRVTAPASGAKVEIMDAQLQWEDVIAWSGYLDRWEYVQAESTSDQALIDENENKIVMEKVGRLLAAWEMDQAMREYEAGNKLRAKERLQRAAKDYKASKKEAEAKLGKPVEQRAMPEDRSYELDEPAPAKVAPTVDAPDVELNVQTNDSGGWGLGDYLEKAADLIEEEEAESDKGKILIKKVKRRSRIESGR